MELAGISTPAAALVAGLVTSLHCAGMCGPLACMLAPGRDDRADPQAVATTYHLSRLTGYTLLGLVAGAAGEVPARFFGQHFVRYMPWIMVVFLLMVALRLDRRMPQLAGLAKLRWRLQASLQGRSRLRVAAVMGLATPILPCGPLYFLVMIAAFSGSALNGAELLLSFGLGTIPLLWIVQAGYGRLRFHLSPVWLSRFQTTLALLTAIVLTWRLRGDFGLDGPSWTNFICH